MPTIGKRYFGPDETAVIVTAIDAGAISIVRPISFQHEQWTEAEFAAFIGASDRRTINRDGETRVFLKAENLPEGCTVFWMEQDNEVMRSTAAEWSAWLAG